MREWWLFSDIDGTLTGDAAALDELRSRLEADADRVGFAVASGRSQELVAAAVEEFGLPEPEVAICSVGSRIQGPGFRSGSGPDDWPGLLAADWDAARLQELLVGVEGLELQEAAGQDTYKLSYLADADTAARVQERLPGLQLIHSAGKYLDVLPGGVSKGSAVRFAARKLGVPLDRVVVAGDSGNDRDMLLCGARAILVANHSSEAADLAGHARVFSASRAHAGGIIEGMVHHGVWSG